MSAYLTYDQIRAGLPAEITAQLLDDEGTGMPNLTAWTELLAAVTREIDGKIGQRYALPLPDPVPAIIGNAAFVLAAELLYQRRNYYGEANPWSARADAIRGTMGQKGGQPGLLDKLVCGDQPLTPTIQRQRPSVSVIAEPARTASTRLSI